ncbi:MAG TPA: hypothetical protein VIH85_12560 [Solirubrobacteraceae bacterium]
MRLLRRAAGPFFVLAGAMHFVIPRAYRRIVPPYLPAPTALVYASGVAEIAGGAGLIPKATRRSAGWSLIATMVAVFPANLHMALHPDGFPTSRAAQPACGPGSRSRPRSLPECSARCAASPRRR